MTDIYSPPFLAAELNSDKLIELTKNVWDSITHNSNKYGEVIALSPYEEVKHNRIVFELNDVCYNQVKEEFPFVYKKLVFFDYPPGGGSPNHIDGGPTSEYAHKYNYIVPVELNDKTVTTYYEDAETIYYPQFNTRKAVDNDLIPVKQFVINKPTIFYTQKLHGAINFGDTHRIVATWKIAKEFDIEEVLAWLENSSITINQIA